MLAREVVAAGVATSAAIAWARAPRGTAAGFTVALGEVLSPEVTGPAVFDLASLTKPVTATVVMQLVAAGLLSLGTRVADALPELSGSSAADASIEELLAHRAGLPAWGALYRRDPWAVRAPASLPPDGPWSGQGMVRNAASRRDAPGWEVYSDIGYVLLGEIAARTLGAPLADAWARLGLADARARRAADPASLERMPPTERLDWRGVVRGEVHDENAAMLERAGGSPGHAGAFGTALEVCAFAARFAQALEGEGDLLPATLARAMIAPRPAGAHTLGWDLRSGDAPSSGARFGIRTFGHLGFTGTSVWIDPDARAIAVLLTNRTWPSRDHVAIRAARPRVHDALWAIEP
ncbi:MAG: beta-lactamase family protein [Deltaproteobacteria bacterium]|nr:beta-lactamase family protein [Deltaproteobacteria bacterium]